MSKLSFLKKKMLLNEGEIMGSKIREALTYGSEKDNIPDFQQGNLLYDR